MVSCSNRLLLVDPHWLVHPILNASFDGLCCRSFLSIWRSGVEDMCEDWSRILRASLGFGLMTATFYIFFILCNAVVDNFTHLNNQYFPQIYNALIDSVI